MIGYLSSIETMMASNDMDVGNILDLIPNSNIVAHTASFYIFAWPFHYLLQIPFRRAKAFLNINRLNNEINRSLNERTDDRKPSVSKLPLFEKDQLFVI
jgi:hypothetical protein